MRLLPFLLFFLLFADDRLAAVGFDKILCLLNRLRAGELHLLARAHILARDDARGDLVSDFRISFLPVAFSTLR